MSNCLVASVIILGYNGKRFLGECISSVFQQDLPSEDYEVIYADNASTDGSADYVASTFPTVRVLRFPANYGYAEGNNRAVARARGCYIVFLNQDTIVHRRWLPELIRAMREHPEVKACHSVAVPFIPGEPIAEPKPGDPVVYADVGRFGSIEFSLLGWGDPYVPTLLVSGGSAMIAKELVEQQDYIFDRDFFMYGEDIDLGLRLNGLGHRILCVPTSLYYHAWEGRARLRMANVVRFLRATRNRFLAYFKNTDLGEFVRIVPLLLLGSTVKLRYARINAIARIAYAALTIPFSLVCMAIAVVMFPRFLGKRRAILETRIKKHGWVVAELDRRRQAVPVRPGVSMNDLVPSRSLSGSIWGK